MASVDVKPATAAEDRSAEDGFGEDRTDLGVTLCYRADPKKLGQWGKHYLPLCFDTEGESFLATVLGRKYRKLALRAHRLLTLFLSDFDTNALLGAHPVFLFSTAQAQQLLGECSSARLLDIGAGSGDVTTRLVPLVDELTCTETSRGMSRRLRKRGLSCWTGCVGDGQQGDPLDGSTYDIVSLFNVIDRCRSPRSLLRSAVEHLAEGGRLLLATPLPFDPFYYRGGRTLPPEEKLAIESDCWEVAVSQLIERELLPLGLRLESLSRAPYLSGGNARHPLYLLDDAILVLRKTSRD